LRVVVEPEYEPDTARGTPVNVTTTPIFMPGGAGAWMWAANAGADRPEKVSVHVDVEVDWSNVNVMKPVATVLTGGTSLLPVKVAVHIIMLPAAWAG
jgi:hypothetical protein